MDTFNHNGLVYVKASILAKRHRYTTDYIGQLCRQNKVDAQLVGRAWYVNEHSLLSHKIDRKKDTRPNEIISKNAVEIDVVQPENVVRLNVHPVTSKKTFRQFFSTELPAPVNHHWQNRAVAYVDDAATLVPQVTNKIIKSLVESHSENTEPAALPVNLAESETIPVHATTDAKKHLTFTDLPEVALIGDLPIKNMDTESDFLDQEPINEADFEPESDVAPEKSARPGVTLRYSRSSHKPTQANAFAERVALKTQIPVTPAKKPVEQSAMALTSPKPPVFVPSTISHVRRGPVLLLPIVILAAVVCATFLMAGSSTLQTDGSTARESFSFRISTLTGALIFFSQKP